MWAHEWAAAARYATLLLSRSTPATTDWAASSRRAAIDRQRCIWVLARRSAAQLRSHPLLIGTSTFLAPQRDLIARLLEWGTPCSLWSRRLYFLVGIRL
jgi:hypothetical protein